MATAQLTKADEKVLMQAAARTASNPESDPVTGADLGAGPGAGTMTKTRK
jgi:Mn-containing catalase